MRVAWCLSKNRNVIYTRETNSNSLHLFIFILYVQTHMSMCADTHVLCAYPHILRVDPHVLCADPCVHMNRPTCPMCGPTCPMCGLTCPYAQTHMSYVQTHIYHGSVLGPEDNRQALALSRIHACFGAQAQVIRWEAPFPDELLTPHPDSHKDYVHAADSARVGEQAGHRRLIQRDSQATPLLPKQVCPPPPPRLGLPRPNPEKSIQRKCG